MLVEKLCKSSLSETFGLMHCNSREVCCFVITMSSFNYHLQFVNASDDFNAAMPSFPFVLLRLFSDGFSVLSVV